MIYGRLELSYITNSSKRIRKMEIHSIHSFEAHKDSILTVAEIGDHGQVVTASKDNTVKVWSVEEEKCLQMFLGSMGDIVRDVSVIDDSKILYVTYRKVKIVSVDRSLNLESSEFRNVLVSCSVTSECSAVIGDYKGNIFKVGWDSRKIHTINQVNRAHNDIINRIDSADGNFVTCSRDKRVKLWKSDSLELIKHVTDHTDSVMSVAMDEKYMVSGSRDTTINIYNAKTYGKQATVRTHSKPVSCVRIVKGSEFVLSTGGDKIIAIHSLSSGEKIATYNVGMYISSFAILNSGIVAIGCSTHSHFLELIELPEYKKHLQLNYVPPPSHLELAFSKIMSGPHLLTLQFIEQNVKKEYVKTASDLFYGHNIILLAIRSRIITADSLHKFNGNLWFFEENLYFPASKLSSESPSLLYPIFYHAQDIGIIRDGHAYRREHENRVDSRRQFESIREHLKDVSEKLVSLTENVETNHNNFQLLYEAIQKKERNLQYSSIAKIMISLIPVLGFAAGATAEASAEVLFSLSSFEEMGIKGINAGIDKIAHVDMSNLQVTYCVFSEENINRMTAGGKTSVLSMVEKSGFKTVDSFRDSVGKLIRTKEIEDEDMAKLDIGSSAWKSNQKEKLHSTLSVVQLQFREFSGTRENKEIDITEASEAINKALELLEIDRVVTEDEFESIFTDVSEGHDCLDVSEEWFCKVAEQIMNGELVDEKLFLEKEYGKIYDKRVTDVGRSDIGIKYAIRLLKHAQKKIQSDKKIKSSLLSNVVVTEDILVSYDEDNDGRVTRDEFISAALSIIHGY